MTAKTDQTERAYAQPKLTVYGTVRNLTGGSQDVGDDTIFPAGKNPRSDRRCKENIQHVGDHPAGFGVYLFDYKAEFRGAGDHERQFGVMADEVEAVIPDAVSYDDKGYRFVDYARLGITRH